MIELWRQYIDEQVAKDMAVFYAAFNQEPFITGKISMSDLSLETEEAPDSGQVRVGDFGR
jgi:hypothetical protein